MIASNIFKSIYVITFLLISCNSEPNQQLIEKWKGEIMETEKAFEKMANTVGLKKAFSFYAAEGAVLERNDVLIKGKSSIEKSFNNASSENKKVSLSWTPDFIDVSNSGDLAYTYGKYQFSATDSTGNTKTTEGIFHTVWKRQVDGSWKYVWD